MEERIAMGAHGQPQSLPERKDGWTANRRERFIDHLRISCNVSASCREVGMSEAGAYKHRKRNAAFRADWKVAINEAVERLEMMLLRRSMDGQVVEKRERGGEIVKTIEYPDRIALALIGKHKDEAAAVDVPEDESAADALRKRIERKLDLLIKREERALAATAMCDPEMETQAERRIEEGVEAKAGTGAGS